MGRKQIPASVFVALVVALAARFASAAACDTPAHRAFDFWLGSWEVRTPGGKLAGFNCIDREYGVCFLHERCTTEKITAAKVSMSTTSHRMSGIGPGWIHSARCS